MDVAERELLASSLVRAAAAHTGADLDAALDDIGWTDALAVEPRAAVAALFEAQGAVGATSSALTRLLLAALRIDVRPGTGLVLPALTSGAAPGRLDGAGSVVGVGLGDLRRCQQAVVVAEHDGTWHVTMVETAALSPREVDGMDPALGLVALDATPAATGPWQLVEGDWDDAVRVGRLALGHELVGAMRTMLALAREHALARIQFDRPIAAFQAVRHRLAESLVAIEAADAALDGAWQDGTPFGAAVAKAVAGHRAREVRRHCQQVLAGIGFTAEHDLHRFVRRTMVLDALLGDARSLSREIGASLIEARRLPSVLPL